MIGLILGFFILGLGRRGFTPAGLPLFKQRHLTGPKARVIGALCLGFGVLLLVDGLL